MNEGEVRVTTLTAAILRNAGFNLMTHAFYTKDGNCIEEDEPSNFNDHSINAEYRTKYDVMSAPTMEVAMKWLRDKKVYVWIEPIDVKRNSFFVPQSVNTNRWQAMVWYDKNHFATAYYKEYDDAEDAGIHSGAQFVKELNL